MRKYLVSGFLTYAGGAVRPMAGTAVLRSDEIMDQATLEDLERILLAQNNRTGTIATSMRVTHFQAHETKDSAPFTAPDVQLNECSVVLPPVDSPLLIEIFPGVLLQAHRVEHALNRDDQLRFKLATGEFIGRPRWTHP